jgi:hypothetical protein
VFVGRSLPRDALARAAALGRSPRSGGSNFGGGGRRRRHTWWLTLARSARSLAAHGEGMVRDETDGAGAMLGGAPLE